jgi:polyferredoxin
VRKPTPPDLLTWTAVAMVAWVYFVLTFIIVKTLTEGVTCP